MNLINSGSYCDIHGNPLHIWRGENHGRKPYAITDTAGNFLDWFTYRELEEIKASSTRTINNLKVINW